MAHRIPSKEEVAKYIDTALDAVEISKVGPIVKPSRNGTFLAKEDADKLVREGKEELLTQVLDQNAFTVFIRVLDALMPRVMEYKEPPEPWKGET